MASSSPRKTGDNNRSSSQSELDRMSQHFEDFLNANKEEKYIRDPSLPRSTEMTAYFQNSILTILSSSIQKNHPEYIAPSHFAIGQFLIGEKKIDETKENKPYINSELAEEVANLEIANPERRLKYIMDNGENISKNYLAFAAFYKVLTNEKSPDELIEKTFKSIQKVKNLKSWQSNLIFSEKMKYVTKSLELTDPNAKLESHIKKYDLRYFNILKNIDTKPINLEGEDKEQFKLNLLNLLESLPTSQLNKYLNHKNIKALFPKEILKSKSYETFEKLMKSIPSTPVKVVVPSVTTASTTTAMNKLLHAVAPSPPKEPSSTLQGAGSAAFLPFDEAALEKLRNLSNPILEEKQEIKAADSDALHPGMQQPTAPDISAISFSYQKMEPTIPDISIQDILTNIQAELLNHNWVKEFSELEAKQELGYFEIENETFKLPELALKIVALIEKYPPTQTSLDLIKSIINRSETKTPEEIKIKEKVTELVDFCLGEKLDEKRDLKIGPR